MIRSYNLFSQISPSTPNLQRAPISSNISNSIPPNFSYRKLIPTFLIVVPSIPPHLPIYSSVPKTPFTPAQNLSKHLLPIPLAHSPIATSAYTFYKDGSSFLSHIRLTPPLSAPSGACSFEFMGFPQISSLFSHSYFSSAQMIAKHPLTTQSPTVNNCPDILGHQTL